MRGLLVVAGLGLAVVPGPARAGAELGQTVTGEAFDAGRLRGRVVLVFHWSTRCAVCMDKWTELRANARGWAGKPFTLVAVNVDPMADWRDYERSVALVQPHAGNVVSLHAPAGPRRLPTTVVLDAQGQVVSRVEGRWSPELWDNMADMLP